MIRSLGTLVLLGMIGVIGYQIYFQINPCARVIEYTVAQVDKNFDLEREEFLSYIQDAEKIWEDEVGRELFVYNPDASFEINLVFDERQEWTLESQTARDVLDRKSDEVDRLQFQYETAKSDLDRRRRTYDTRVRTYDRRLSEYNTEINEWNQQGGAPQQEFARLEEEKRWLASESTELERIRRSINTEVSRLNELAGELTRFVASYNAEVQEFNRIFGTSVEFNQGIYNGRGIDIYQFSEPQDLKAVLAHELGHALGFEHVNDPQAIMYYKIDSEAHPNLALTEADKRELMKACQD